MKIYQSRIVIVALILSIFTWACQKEENEKSVSDQLVAKWQGQTIHADVYVNGLKIDSLTQDMNIDTIQFEFDASGKYHLTSGNYTYSNNWALERNNTELKLDGFEELFQLLPDTIPPPETTIFISELTDTKLVLEGESEISIQFQGFPVLLKIESLITLNKLP